MKKVLLIAVVCVCPVVTQGQVPEKQATPAPDASVPAPEPPKLVLSEVENLKKQILQLKRDLINCEVLPSQQALSKEVSAYIDEVMKAHKNPAYRFNPQTMEFEYVPPSKLAKPEK